MGEHVMMRTVTAATAALILLVASPAAAARKTKTELTLSYMAEAGYAAAVILRCHPAGGPHPKKGKACQALTKINGNPADFKPAPLMCTLEYAPITATITGSWQGTKVDWSRTFGNRCEMNRTTGVVMAF
jgi:hypothetical protein